MNELAPCAEWSAVLQKCEAAHEQPGPHHPGRAVLLLRQGRLGELGPCGFQISLVTRLLPPVCKEFLKIYIYKKTNRKSDLINEVAALSKRGRNQMVLFALGLPKVFHRRVSEMND